MRHLEHLNFINEYFEWMYNLVCDDNYFNNEGMSHRHLLKYIHDIEFFYVLDMDSNRAEDGMDLRHRFAYDNEYPYGTVERYLGNRPCSVLEMMIALALRVEEQIMDDPEYGDRTGQWFWNMISSLGLGGMTDERFDKRYVDDVIYDFLYRQYSPDGAGGLFTIHDKTKPDMRDVEIWYQCMWYLNEVT